MYTRIRCIYATTLLLQTHACAVCMQLDVRGQVVGAQVLLLYIVVFIYCGVYILWFIYIVVYIVLYIVVYIYCGLYRVLHCGLYRAPALYCGLYIFWFISCFTLWFISVYCGLYRGAALIEYVCIYRVCVYI